MKNVIRNGYFILRVFFLFLTKKRPKVKTSLETINYILDHKISVTRYGDAELNIINGENMKQQNAPKELGEKLKEVLVNHDDFILTCIPDIYNWRSYRYVKRKTALFWWEQLSQLPHLYFDLPLKDKVYYDAFVSRPYIRYKDKSFGITMFKKWKKLWNQKDIILVEGSLARLGVNNDLFTNAKSIKRILCPIKNAFDKYEDILKAIKFYGKDHLIIVCLGPTATVLTYDLAKEGYWAIDLGHIDLEYDWCSLQADEKVLIDNKYVNELDKQGNFHEETNQNYLNQIVDRIE